MHITETGDAKIESPRGGSEQSKYAPMSSQRNHENIQDKGHSIHDLKDMMKRLR